MRSIWTGAIGFGLVNIPIKLFSAIESSTLDLDMLDKKDHANIKFKRVNENTGKEVPWNNIVRAFNLDGKSILLLKNRKLNPYSLKQLIISNRKNRVKGPMPS